MARQGGHEDEIRKALLDMVGDAPGAVLCTCTTLGPMAASLGAIRVDQPMMAQAAQSGRRILMVYCLESTRQPSLDLLKGEIARAGGDAQVDLLSLAPFWPLFEAGQTAAFHAAIASAVENYLHDHAQDCVVLAQASMAGAAARLAGNSVPVLASPETALRAILQSPPIVSTP